MRSLMIGVAAGALLLVGGALLIDEGEVVVLVTTGAEGDEHETPLWTVELDGVLYLRASVSDARWLERLRGVPIVRLRETMGEESPADRRFRAVPLDERAPRERVNVAMAAKYGLADRLWAAVGDRGASIPVRLDPVPPESLAGVATSSDSP